MKHVPPNLSPKNLIILTVPALANRETQSRAQMGLEKLGVRSRIANDGPQLRVICNRELNFHKFPKHAYEKPSGNELGLKGSSKSSESDTTCTETYIWFD